MEKPKHNPGEPEFGEHDEDAPTNPGEPEYEEGDGSEEDAGSEGT